MINNSQRHEEIKQWYEEIDLTNKNQTKTNKQSQFIKNYTHRHLNMQEYYQPMLKTCHVSKTWQNATFIQTSTIS